jgi:hypothetical protein
MASRIGNTPALLVRGRFCPTDPKADVLSMDDPRIPLSLGMGLMICRANAVFSQSASVTLKNKRL